MGGASISEGRLLELLQEVDKYCFWFLSIGTLDLKVWEKSLGKGWSRVKERTYKRNSAPSFYLVYVGIN